jgi:hypothetical protein
MSILGLREWFATGPAGTLNSRPDGALGWQVFFYQAEDPGTYSRHGTGLHHLAFLVEESGAVEREARARGLEIDDVVDAPNTRAVFLVGPDRIRLEYVEHKPGFSLT